MTVQANLIIVLIKINKALLNKIKDLHPFYKIHHKNQIKKDKIKIFYHQTIKMLTNY